MENKIFAAIRLRLLASYVDLAILSLPIAFLLFYVGTSSNIPIFVQRSFLLLIVLLLFIIINLLHDIFFTHYFGGPIGKLLTGLRVVDENGNKLTLKRSFFRHTVGYQFSAILFGLGFLAIIKDPQKQAWHDKAVGSKVIVERKNWPLALFILLSFIILNLYILYSAFTTAFSGPLPKEFQTFMKSFQTKKEKTHPSTGSKDLTANWQTYRSDEFGFEVRYPTDWNIYNPDIASKSEVITFIKEPSGEGIDIHSRTVSIIVESNPQRSIPTIEWYKNEWAKQIPAGINFDNVNFEEATLQNLPALKVNNAIFFQRASHMFRIEWGVIDFGNADPKLVDLTEQAFDQILSTFRFVDVASQADIDTKTINKFCAKNSDCKLIYSSCDCEVVPISDTRTRLEDDLDRGAPITCIRNSCDGRTGIVTAICENSICVKSIE